MLLMSAIVLAQDSSPSLTEAKKAFAKADRGLNEAWSAVKKAVPAKVFDEMKAKQREWVDARDRVAAEAGAKDSANYWERAAKLTEERADWLRRLANKEDDPLTGLWSDGNGGDLEVVARPNQLLFVFHTVRGRGFDTGVIAGTAAWNTSIGWFSDKGREPDKTDETISPSRSGTDTLK
jgi:uncharacterized protein YecT (DUF1311 family)